MQIILTGATGAAGLEVLRTAIADTSITKISVLSRRPLPDSIPQSDKVSFIKHTDFTTYPPEVLKSLEGHGACVWALGKTSAGMNEADYTTLTYDYPMAAIKAFDSAGIRGEDGKLRFVYFSGEGAKPDGNGGALFARVKGRAEKDLAAYAAGSTAVQVYNIRPGYFFPSNPKDAATVRNGGARIMDKVLGPTLNFALSSMYIKIEDLARFALEAGKGRAEPGTISNASMKEYLKKWNTGTQ
ncbi:uncharacterized protein FOMMEDRAFT_103763 [Fomitiporia mediterranea MF3/22]|uniref:uncharacterized protein n=1 Tax=Fomitiporia mediterranea (strain MF3/22) TaxID=694068 RepID=UPI0004407F58|nr:uncharacterized protein FOMMEDRAFT_103763 [Fomitiporia mediterranea MF3/22]EJD05628.1 hypothetical protein FOMMEDRAFT_103763 [Fomitiporia mediterranea MF3/22]